jgi:hypothetical protein
LKKLGGKSRISYSWGIGVNYMIAKIIGEIEHTLPFHTMEKIGKNLLRIMKI